MKHLVTDYHFVRDLVQSVALHVVHVSINDQLADALSHPRLLDLCHEIGVSSSTPF